MKLWKVTVTHNLVDRFQRVNAMQLNTGDISAARENKRKGKSANSCVRESIHQFFVFLYLLVCLPGHRVWLLVLRRLFLKAQYEVYFFNKIQMPTLIHSFSRYYGGYEHCIPICPVEHRQRVRVIGKWQFSKNQFDPITTNNFCNKWPRINEELLIVARITLRDFQITWFDFICFRKAKI